MKILAIETSCDETALAVVEASGGLRHPRFKILKNLVASQINIHRPFGGVVPNLAKREHIKNLPILLKKLTPNTPALPAGRQNLKPDLIAVTVGPGLEPALWTGITFAQSLAKEWRVPLLGANHLEGHLYSFLLPKEGRARPDFKRIFPGLGLIVSGGHTILLLLKNLKAKKKLGETRDDAVGEAFDKVARILGLPYPGGPEIEKIAARGNPAAIPFPRPMMHTKDYDFSFSGLKTSVLYYVRDHLKPNTPALPAGRQNLKPNIAASFEQAAVDVLVYKTLRAAKALGARSVLLSGGVAANKLLRKNLEGGTRKLGLAFLVADFKYNTDNAVMIAAAAYMNFLKKKKYPLVARGNLNI